MTSSAVEVICRMHEDRARPVLAVLAPWFETQTNAQGIVLAALSVAVFHRWRASQTDGNIFSRTLFFTFTLRYPVPVQPQGSCTYYIL